MNILAYTNDHGEVNLVFPAARHLSDEQRARRCVPPRPDGSPRTWIAVPPGAVPHVAYQQSLVLNGQALTVDLARARECWKSHQRARRAPLFAALDQLHNEATAKGDAATAKAVERRRQALRDVTKADLSRAATIADLLAIVPAVLATERAAQAEFFPALARRRQGPPPP